MSKSQFKSFKEFWPFYLGEHLNPLNRALHFIGVSGVLILAFVAFENRKPALFLLAPFIGYGFAWVGHFCIEKNKPATFQYPFYSLMGDFKMYFMMLTGRTSLELRQISTEKRKSGFGMLELLISSALVVSMLFIYLKMHQSQDSAMRKTLETQGITLPSPGGASQDVTQAAGKAIEAKIKAEEDEHLKQVDCQSDPSQCHVPAKP